MLKKISPLRPLKSGKMQEINEKSDDIAVAEAAKEQQDLLEKLKDMSEKAQVFSQ